LRAIQNMLGSLNSTTSINPYLNKVTVADNKCSDCGRKLVIENGREFCFRCDEILPTDKAISKETKSRHEQMKLEKAMSGFKDVSLMNVSLESATLNEYKAVTDSQKAAKKRAAEYIMNFDGRTGLCFMGKPGVGKSHIGASIAKAVAKQKIENDMWRTSIFISMPRLLTEIKSTYNRESDRTEMDILRGLQRADLLVIDDLGAERFDENDKGGKWSKAKLFEIADSRAGKATIFTTNYTFAELIAMYGERDFGRMMENVEPVKMDGQDYRLRNFER
jgi:DNA replication protein DnaC